MKKKLLEVWHFLFAPSPLRRKFLRAFLIVGLVPLLLTGILSIYLLNLVHRIDITALERNLARETAGEVRKVIDEIIDNVELEVTAQSFLPLKDQREVLPRLLERHTSLSELSFICTDQSRCVLGRETSRFVRDTQSTSTTETDYLTSPLFALANQGTTSVGALLFEGGVVRGDAAGPVLDNNREIIGVLYGKFTLAPLHEIVTTNRLGETGYVYVVDEKGTIIAHPNLNFLGKNLAELLKMPPDFSISATNQTYQNFEGEMVSGFSLDVPGLPWKTIVEWPRVETQAVIWTMVRNVIQFSLGSVLLILIIGGIMTSGLIRPISLLKQGVQAIGQGNFDYRIQLQTHDELQELGNRLNAMAGDLKRLEELHELQVRTQTLGESLRKEQELSNLKDQFVRTVSHQFNTPLSVIHWALEMVNGPDANAETIKEGLSSINQSRKDILAMVDNLLTLSEVGFHYQVKDPITVDFRKMVSEAITKLHEDISAKNLTIKFTEGSSDLTAKVNEFAMSKVIENLISNAIHYSHQGSKIEIYLTAEPQKLTFRISDQGIGIPTEDQKSIFQEFFRASNAIEKKNIGTGVGLFIAKTIIEGHGGKIWFESKHNQGTSFYFTIPR